MPTKAVLYLILLEFSILMIHSITAMAIDKSFSKPLTELGGWLEFFQLTFFTLFIINVTGFAAFLVSLFMILLFSDALWIDKLNLIMAIFLDIAKWTMALVSAHKILAHTKIALPESPKKIRRWLFGLWILPFLFAFIEWVILSYLKTEKSIPLGLDWLLFILAILIVSSIYMFFYLYFTRSKRVKAYYGLQEY